MAGAQQKLADAGGWSGTLELNIYADDPVLEQAAEAITNQWKTNLGIDAKINAIPYNTWYGNTIGKKFTGPWFLDGWVMDYPSMEDYLSPLYAANGAYANTGYDNPQFEDLMKQGDEALSVEASLPFYQQADDIVLEDMPVDPVGIRELQYGEPADGDQRGQGWAAGRARARAGPGSVSELSTAAG